MEGSDEKRGPHRQVSPPLPERLARTASAKACSRASSRYKLLMATTTGVVKEVFQGPENRFKVGGLRSNHEYVFCVKAIYDDGSFLWSESKAFRTKS